MLLGMKTGFVEEAFIPPTSPLVPSAAMYSVTVVATVMETYLSSCMVGTAGAFKKYSGVLPADVEAEVTELLTDVFSATLSNEDDGVPVRYTTGWRMLAGVTSDSGRKHLLQTLLL